MRREPADPDSLERQVRQLLANKVCGTMCGLWLLLAEHLRLGTWDLLCGWTRRSGQSVEPRLALQLVHEATLCVSGVRQQRTLSQKGFELANGLPFVACDRQIHQLLAAHTVAEAQYLQVALGLIRRARGHFEGRLLAIDPHRIPSYSKRQMRRYRCKHRESSRAQKCAQTFFALDADTHQPVCFLTGSASRTVAQATAELLPLAGRILHDPQRCEPTLALADCEHYVDELIDLFRDTPGFDLLVAMPNQPYLRSKLHALAAETFKPCWAGLAMASEPIPSADADSSCFRIVQRCGERADNYSFKAFLCTALRESIESLIINFPQRWHIEEFFHIHQGLGWDRAGTLNLNIRYGQMTMALIAQAALFQLRQRLGPPYSSWDAPQFAKGLLSSIDGDIRVEQDTIVVTLYNAPDVPGWHHHFENLPTKLQAEGVDPRIPWLYDFKLDFRFR